MPPAPPPPPPPHVAHTGAAKNQDERKSAVRRVTSEGRRGTLTFMGGGIEDPAERLRTKLPRVSHPSEPKSVTVRPDSVMGLQGWRSRRPCTRNRHQQRMP